MVRRLLPLVVLALAVPASASAGLATLQVRELPLHGERTLAAATGGPFQLVGIHWQGPGRLELRIRTGDGWTRWRPVQEDEGDAPDAGTAEARESRAWRLGAPVWVGRGDGLEVRAVGRVTRARALTVRSPVSKVPVRTVAAAGIPQIVPRSGWLADEAIRKEKPVYADTLRMAFVHHTAGTNDYTRLQAPAIVRAIELYHVKGNGWNDIGYNALVDRFGTVYEGRYGGIDRNVVGAHAKGFNTGSFGIAVMGDFRTAAPPGAAVDALVRTLAWRLDLAHVDPLAMFTAISSGNERFNPGIPVLPACRVGSSGHRADDVPRAASLRPHSDDRAPGCHARAPEGIRAHGRDGRIRRHALHGQALRGPPVDGHGDRRERRRARARRRNGRGRRLDLAARRTRSGGHAVADRDAGRDGGGRRPRRYRRGSARGDRCPRGARSDHPQRRRAGRYDDDLVHARRERERRGHRRGRERYNRRRARAEAVAPCRCADHRLRRTQPSGRGVCRPRHRERDRRPDGRRRRASGAHPHARPHRPRLTGHDAERRRSRRHALAHRPAHGTRRPDRADPSRRPLDRDAVRGDARAGLAGSDVGRPQAPRPRPRRIVRRGGGGRRRRGHGDRSRSRSSSTRRRRAFGSSRRSRPASGSPRRRRSTSVSTARAGRCAPTARARSASPESSGSGRSSSSRGTRPGTRRPSGAERRLGGPRQ